MTVVQHPRAFNPESGEVHHDAPKSYAEALEIIVAQNRKLNGAWLEVARLKNQIGREQEEDESAGDVLDVLGYWRNVAMPGAKIVAGGDRWRAVRKLLSLEDAETGKPAYTPLSLKAAVVGLMLSSWHIEHKQLDLFNARRVEDLVSKVDRHIERAIDFKRAYGTSALVIVDELAGESLKWLAERCSCGACWIEHLYHGGPTPDGRQPCTRTGCRDFDWLEAKYQRWLHEQDQRASAGFFKPTQAALWEE